MGKLTATGLYLFKYLLCPFLIILGTIFLIFTILNKLSTSPVSSYSILWESSLFSLIFWSPFFVSMVLAKILSAIIQSEKLRRYEEKHFPKIRIRISIKTRMEIKSYLLILSFSMFLVTLAMLVESYQTYATPPQFSLFGRLVFIFSYLATILLLMISLIIYKQEERAIFFFDRFFRSINLYQSNLRIRVDIKDFEKALKSYQKTLPSFYALKNLKEIVGRTQLVLNRGTSDEITKTQMFIHSLSNSIKTHDKPLFDKTLIEMNKFLVDMEAGKKDIIQINVSRKELLQSSFKKVLSESMREILVALVLLSIIIIFYFVFGIKLPWI